MSAEVNNNVVERFWNEVVNGKHLEVVDKLFTADCILHDPVVGTGKGLDKVKKVVGMIHTALPNVRVNIEAQIVAENNHLVTRWIGTGTHTGRFEDVEPSGRRVEVWGISISRVIGDRIHETWFVMEPLVHEKEDEGPVSMFCRYFPKLC
jgi:predicted ester cyclase